MDYTTAYYLLFNRISDAIHLLQDTQQEAAAGFLEEETEPALNELDQQKKAPL